MLPTASAHSKMHTPISGARTTHSHAETQNHLLQTDTHNEAGTQRHTHTVTQRLLDPYIFSYVLLQLPNTPSNICTLTCTTNSLHIEFTLTNIHVLSSRETPIMTDTQRHAGVRHTHTHHTDRHTHTIEQAACVIINNGAAH